MRMHFIVDWLNPTMKTLLTLLTQRGVRVQCLFPEQQASSLPEVRCAADLYVLKSGSELALSLAGCLHLQGAAIINPYPTVAMMRNKIIVSQALNAVGVPVPATYVANRAEELRPMLDEGPLLLKPYRGSRGIGIRIVRQVAEVGEPQPNVPLLAQKYLPPDGPDHKIFRIGERYFGVKRVWPLRTYDDKTGVPFEPDASLRDIAARCGQLFGIDLYGLDVIYHQGKPFVVDVNKFGSYMGLPDAPELLAEYLYAAGERAMERQCRG